VIERKLVAVEYERMRGDMATVIPDHLALRPAVAALPTERRHLVHRKQLSNRVRGEFEEMPGMCLTVAQASRLFHVQPDVCARLFSELIDDGVLILKIDGRYRLRADAA
jgi:hypothetical protein